MSTADGAVCGQDVGRIYQDHHGWLLAFLHRRLGNPCDAADLAQDAFIRMLRRPRAFDSNQGARAYLSAIARGLCVDLWRRQSVEQAYLKALTNRPRHSAPCPERQATVIQALCELDALLQRQPAKAASAFIMAVIEGQKDKEVAEALGVSDRMVRKYVARIMLQCVLLDLHPDL
ncbi:sigma-70 family RNA polymerase sigma factor [Algihabitans sp.]|uniref:sigma-70 family RNA polymerase sigma factor n=1 Tax=Algihabitans sp. TaxID=2821514 RepID=UPI003BA9EFA6